MARIEVETQEVKQGDIDAAVNRVGHATDAVRAVTNILREIGDRLFGGQPSAQNAMANAKPPTSNEIDVLERTISELHVCISTLRDEANRFGRL